MENKRLDKNLSYNIKKLFDIYMTLGNRAECYRRGINID